jgi:hypothetical protein
VVNEWREAITPPGAKALVLPGLVPVPHVHLLAPVGSADSALPLAQRIYIRGYRLGHAHRRELPGSTKAAAGGNGSREHFNLYHPRPGLDSNNPSPVVQGQAGAAGKGAGGELPYCLEESLQIPTSQDPAAGPPPLPPEPERPGPTVRGRRPIYLA